MKHRRPLRVDEASRCLTADPRSRARHEVREPDGSAQPAICPACIPAAYAETARHRRTA